VKSSIFFGLLLLAAAGARAEIRSEPIDYKQGDANFQGILYYDDKISAKRPVVLVVHEWWGLNDYAKSRAEQIARLGYIGFAVDMYGKGVRAANVDEAGKMSGAVKANRPLLRARISAALDAIKSNTRVDPGKIAIMGYCFGGTVSLELARSGAPIAGAVSFHGALATPNPADAKNIKCKILVCHGGDDPFVPPTELQDFQKEMQSAKVNYQINIYGGAVHTFTNPDAAKAGLQGVAYNEQADKRSWEAMKDFFVEVLGPPGK